MKTGLVLEGGAMRGMYTAGILDIFLENGITSDAVVGASAGALFGVNLLSRQEGRVIRYNKRFNGQRGYMGLLPLLREGSFISTDFAYRRVPYELDPFDDETYRRSGVPFYAVVTDVATGEPEYLQVHSVFEQMDVLRASGSMPLISRPVRIGEKEYLDGGISDSIPFLWLAEKGYDRLVVVLTRDPGYRKKPMPGFFLLPYRKKYPAVVEKLRQRHELYNRSAEELKQWEEQGRAFVFRPSAPIRIKRLEKDPKRLQEVYDLGRADAMEKLASLKAYLSAPAEE